jgi:ribonuclease-3 family protein
LERLYDKDCNPKLLSPLTLAFIGDGVFELFVRERLVCKGNCPVKALHKSTVAQVCCSAQAEASKKLLPILTQDETEVYLRGRNAHTNHVPKNSSIADYHAATAFEALFGYVYLMGKLDRLRELFELMCDNA